MEHTEALMRKHEAFEKVLEAQDEKVNFLYSKDTPFSLVI